jgi:N-acetylmuramic acid 6-phosphate etherase
MTELVDTRYRDIDLWPTATAIQALWESQLGAVAAIQPALGALGVAVDLAVARLAHSTSGRLVYVGAGTSIRVAVQDGTELGPTFDWPDARCAYIIAGGPQALMHGIEGAEDSRDDAIAQMLEAGVGPNDVVIGVAASGRTPFTIAALETARAAGALTIGLSNNADTPVLAVSEAPICVETGAELIAGSTRMKAGTTQKIVLNMISTQVMIGLGRVYQGLMVDMRPANIKLRGRAVGMVARIAGVSDAAAQAALTTADWQIKRAVLVAHGQTLEQSAEILAASGDNLRRALGTLD